MSLPSTSARSGAQLVLEPCSSPTAERALRRSEQKEQRERDEQQKQQQQLQSSKDKSEASSLTPTSSAASGSSAQPVSVPTAAGRSTGAQQSLLISSASSSLSSSTLSSASSSSCNSSSSSSSSSPSLGVLARCTALPSPVAIPPNVFGLTYLNSFLSAAECSELIRMADQSAFHRSVVVSDSVTYVSQLRTSFSCALVNSTPLGEHNRASPLVASLLQRVADITGVSQAHVEAMDFVRYEPGQCFKPHCDDFGNSTKPRRWSIFTYLNDVTGGGGETHFTQLGVKFKPKQGDALWWENCPAPYRPGVYHESSEHEGCPPLSGVKYGE